MNFNQNPTIQSPQKEKVQDLLESHQSFEQKEYKDLRLKSPFYMSKRHAVQKKRTGKPNKPSKPDETISLTAFVLAFTAIAILLLIFLILRLI
jgi:hypothetical protein